MYPNLNSDHNKGTETFRFKAWALDDDTAAVEEDGVLIIITKEDLIRRITEGGSWNKTTRG